MKVDKLISKQIEALSTSLITTSFQIDYNWVSNKGGKIAWDNFKDISFALKEIPYVDLYRECIKERAFNFLLLDGAIIQMMYECTGDEIIKHRLAFYPNPNIDNFQDDPENFEEIHFGRDLFSEIYEQSAIVFPIRFDYDNDKKRFIEHDHSYSHLTLGNYKNCRIPVSRPITPMKFVHLILKSFYFDKFKEHYSETNFECKIKLHNSISDSEARYIHIG